MSERITFIHAADLHLGAPFKGLRALSDTWADRLIDAIPQAFARLVDTAIARKVDFMVIAGDIFDASHPSYRDFLHFFNGLGKLRRAGIPVYFCTGNHDPYTSWQQGFADLPDNAHMFPADKPGYFVFERDGAPLALLGGRGYYSQSVADDIDLAQGITRAAGEEACGARPPFAVGVLHTGLDIDPVKAPVDPRELLASGFDYWALGHIHRPYRDSETDPKIAFSGCIQGRDIKDVGPRGCYQVTLEQGAPNKLEFVPLASVVWQRLSVDVSACATVTDIHDAVMRQLFAANGKAQCEEMVERVTLVGATPLHQVLQDPGVLEDLRAQINEEYPVFFCDALIDRTQAPKNRAALAEEGLFPATLLAQSAEQAADREGTLYYLQDAFLQKNLRLPQRCVRNLDRLQAQAEDLALDLLGGVGA